MATNPTPKVVADLYVLRARSRAHRRLVMDLADQGHRAAALEELAMYDSLEEQIDDLVQVLQNQFPADTDDGNAEVVHFPTAPAAPAAKGRRR